MCRACIGVFYQAVVCAIEINRVIEVAYVAVPDGGVEPVGVDAACEHSRGVVARYAVALAVKSDVCCRDVEAGGSVCGDGLAEDVASI